MVHSSSNKRQADNTLKNTHNQNKKSKLEDHSNDNTEKGGLFDDSDEEMDPSVLDSVMQQLNDDDDDDQSASDNDSDDMDLNNDNQSDNDDDDHSITSSDIPEIDPVSDLLQDQNENEDQSLSGDNDETDSQQPDQSSPSAPSTTTHNLSGKFRDHYMGQMTLAFGSDLDTIRQEPGFTGARLNVLIDSLESGITIFSDLEKNIILANANDS